MPMRKTPLRHRVLSSIIVISIFSAFFSACQFSERRAQQHYEEALIQKAKHNYQDAIRLLHLALGEDRDHLESYIELGILFSREKDYQQALTSFRVAEKLGADSYSLSALRGYAFEELGDFQQAEFYYEQALSQAPRLTDVRLRLANILEWQERGSEAAELLRQVLEIDPTIEGAESLRARVEILSRTEGAELHLALADLYFRQDKPRRGTAEYRKALDFAPDDVVGQILFGRFCLEREQFELALDAFQKALQHDATHDFQMSIDMALAHEKLGRLDAAALEYRKALELDPQQAALHLKLAGLYRQLGQNIDAAEHLEQLFRLSLHAQHFHLGNGEFPTANQLWQDILTLREESSSKTVLYVEDLQKAPLVPVIVNQTIEAPMRIEKDLDYTILSDRLTNTLGIQITARTSEVRFNIYGRVETAALVTISSLKVGGLEARNIPILIGDLSRYPDIDGFLGNNFLKHFKMEINYDDRLFILTKLRP